MSRIIDFDSLNFSMRLRVIRTFKNWSSNKLAKELGVTRITLSRWENKKNSPPMQSSKGRDYSTICEKIEKIMDEIIHEMNNRKKEP